MPTFICPFFSTVWPPHIDLIYSSFTCPLTTVSNAHRNAKSAALGKLRYLSTTRTSRTMCQSVGVPVWHPATAWYKSEVRSHRDDRRLPSALLSHLLSLYLLVLHRRSNMAAMSLVLILSIFSLLALIRRAFRRKNLNNLRGPASASVLLGQCLLPLPPPLSLATLILTAS